MIFKPLSEVAKIDISGVNKKIDDGEKFVKLCNFTDVYYNWAVTSNSVASFMTASANDNEIERFTLKKGYVAITKDSETRDDIGIPCLIADDLENTILGYHCALIIPDENQLYGPYLNAYLNSKMARTYFSNQASGSGQRYTLTIGGIGNVKVPVIEMPEQIKIGDLFSKIDKKIENNKILISELESMAKTLYDYWFLQFEFPNEEGKPYKSSGGKMVYNEELKREIPEGWILKHAVDIAEIKTGKEDANHSTENGQYPFFTCSNDTLKCDDYKFDSNSILIAGNGDFNVKHYKGKFNAYQRTYVITPFNEKYIGLFELCCKQTIERFKKGSNGSIVKFITLGDIQNIQMLDGGHDDLLKPFNNVLVKIDVIKKENQELASLRDFLLPMLMNGQVTFK